MKITALAGGVGGAKLANGFAQVLNPGDLSVIVNTGDDFFYSGLYICPDLDTVSYNLAGINDPINGWGLENETWNVLTNLEGIGHPIWFKLGDRDLATHIERTRLLHEGKSLTEVTTILSSRLGIKHKIFPMTDSAVRTIVDTEELGKLAFQEYFVKQKFQPTVRSITFAGSDDAKLTQSVGQALKTCDMIIICPSNPFVSIAPILSIPGMQDLISKKPVIAVSPLIGGRAIKGPAAKLMKDLNITPNSLNVAKYFGSLINGFVLDTIDHDEIDSIRQCGIIPLESNILMRNKEEQARLAREVIEFRKKLD